MIAIAVVVIVVVAAGGIYLATQTGSNSSTTTSQSTTSHTTTQTSTPTQTTTTTHTTSPTQTTTATTPSSTTTTSFSTYSCSSSSTSTTTGQTQTVQSILPFFQSLKGMEVVYNGTDSNGSYNLDSKYTVIYADTSGGVTTYKVFIDFNDGTADENATAWVQSNGNVLAVDIGGFNITGSTAGQTLVGFMAGFTLESTYLNTLEVYTGSYFHSTGTSTVTLGSTTMTVTNYQANSLPETYSECGYTGTINDFAMSVGTVPGTSVTLVTHLHINGTENGDTSDFSIRVVSVTKA